MALIFKAIIFLLKDEEWITIVQIKTMMKYQIN